MQRSLRGLLAIVAGLVAVACLEILIFAFRAVSAEPGGDGSTYVILSLVTFVALAATSECRNQVLDGDLLAILRRALPGAPTAGTPDDDPLDLGELDLSSMTSLALWRTFAPVAGLLSLVGLLPLAWARDAAGFGAGGPADLAAFSVAPAVLAFAAATSPGQRLTARVAPMFLRRLRPSGSGLDGPTSA